MNGGDSLASSRSRRANTGTRLKELIAFEEEADENRQVNEDDDDEKVRLLFQEDEDDVEFEESEEYDSEAEDESAEDDEGDKVVQKVDKELQPKDSDSSDNEIEVNSDEILTESELSESDTDQSEGEKELQKEEKRKQRSERKKQGLVPAIRQPAKPTNKVHKPKPSIPLLESILQSRRSSSRASVRESKDALLKRLEENEKRRARYMPAPRMKHVEKTQEERLAESIETEKANILSLSELQEQEEEKKKRQKELLMLKKVRLKNVIRFITRERFVTPLEEVQEAFLDYEREKKKKRLGRKRKFATEEKRTRLPGEIDEELPIVKAEISAGNLPKNSEDLSLDGANGIVGTKDKEAHPESYVDEQNCDNSPGKLKSELSAKEKLYADVSEKQHDHKKQNGDEKQNGDAKQNGNEKQENTSGPSLSSDRKKESDDNNYEKDTWSSFSRENSLGVEQLESSDVANEFGKNVDNKAGIVEEKSKMPEEKGVNETGDRLETTESKQTETVRADNIGDSEASTNSLPFSADNGELSQLQDKNRKQVKFAGDSYDNLEKGHKEDNDEGKDSSLDDIKENEEQEQNKNVAFTGERIFEGPPQKVASSVLHFIDFEANDEKTELNAINIKKFLFGEQALLPASRRFKDLQTVLKIGQKENPYATPKQEKDRLFQDVMEIDDSDTIFSEIQKLPRLGEIQVIEEELENDQQEEDLPIVIKTEAPTGLYLPNGSKKACLITGTEVKYFDPATGIPYSSVETYRFLKTIEQGNCPWYSLPEELNDNGPVELYLGSRDGSQRHAKGVPEGFASC